MRDLGVQLRFKRDEPAGGEIPHDDLARVVQGLEQVFIFTHLEIIIELFTVDIFQPEYPQKLIRLKRDKLSEARFLVVGKCFNVCRQRHDHFSAETAFAIPFDERLRNEDHGIQDRFTAAGGKRADPAAFRYPVIELFPELGHLIVFKRLAVLIGQLHLFYKHLNDIFHLAYFRRYFSVHNAFHQIVHLHRRREPHRFKHFCRDILFKSRFQPRIDSPRDRHVFRYQQRAQRIIHAEPLRVFEPQHLQVRIAQNIAGLKDILFRRRGFARFPRILRRIPKSTHVINQFSYIRQRLPYEIDLGREFRLLFLSQNGILSRAQSFPLSKFRIYLLDLRFGLFHAGLKRLLVSDERFRPVILLFGRQGYAVLNAFYCRFCRFLAVLKCLLFSDEFFLRCTILNAFYCLL